MERNVLYALVAVLGFWVLNMVLWDWSMWEVTLPLVGTLFAFKPFQLVAPFSVFIGAFIVMVVYKYNKKEE